MTMTPDTRLGSYQILALVGAGGMGEVYHARDLKLGREVAVKVLHAELANEPERLMRFEREARMLASLNHPHIATLYGMEEAGGVKFLVMEYVPGPTLAERLATAALPLEETLSLGRQIADALEAAHDKNVIHRDLKPGNIKFAPDGKLKLLDFGLAKAVSSAGAPAIGTVTFASTREGTVLGTPLYMSPEQVRGEPVDRRTDIWSFGCVLFEALSGQRPFTGPTAADIFAAILEREPDWNVLPAEVPPIVRNLLQRCLRKDVERRVRDIADARIEILEAAEQGRPTGVAPISFRPMAHSAPQMANTTVAFAGTTSRAPELEHVQRGIFITRLRHLHKQQQRSWLPAYVIVALGIGLGVGTLVGNILESQRTAHRQMSSEAPPFWGVLAGVTMALLVGLVIRWIRAISITKGIQRIVKNHPRDTDAWGGEATLRDPLALEGLLHALQRDNK